MNDANGQAVGLAMVAIEQVWTELRQSPFVQRDLGLPIARLPDIGEQAVSERSRRARETLATIAEVDEAQLPHELALTLAVARTTAERMAKESEWYWLVFDPLGVGFFALFAPTAYGGGFMLNSVAGMLAKHRFDHSADLDRYLGLVSDYGRILDQMTERTAGQAERGIHMPRPQLDQSVELVTRLREAAPAVLIPDAGRFSKGQADMAARAITDRVAAVVDPAFERLLGLLREPFYQSAAPADVGISQYPGGEAVYRELVKQHLTLDLTPDQVHQEGLERVAMVRSSMAKLLEEVGFSGSPEDYLAHLQQDPQWRADGAEGIATVFRRYIDRIAPHIDRYFRFKPAAPHDVGALPAALSGSMTFGYYDPPSPEQAAGRYLFNAENLASNALPNIAARSTITSLFPGTTSTSLRSGRTGPSIRCAPTLSSTPSTKAGPNMRPRWPAKWGCTRRRRSALDD
jgi:uncharacterized protein (DUF885 family)